MGYTKGVKWDDKFIEKQIKKVIKRLKLTRFPTFTELTTSEHGKKLHYAICRHGGIEYWSKKLEYSCENIGYTRDKRADDSKRLPKLSAEDIEIQSIKSVYWRVLELAISNYNGKGVSHQSKKIPGTVKLTRWKAYEFLKGEYCICICEIIGLNHNTLAKHLGLSKFEAEISQDENFNTY